MQVLELVESVEIYSVTKLPFEPQLSHHISKLLDKTNCIIEALLLVVKDVVTG